MRGEITVVAVGYNRVSALKRLLDSLDRADYDYTDVRLVISLDYNENKEIVKMSECFEWKYGEKIVKAYPERMGLRKHILSCGDLTEKYGAVMILEDDLYVSPDYYNYAMKALQKYGEHSRIAGIALYTKRDLLESVYPFFPLKTGDDIYFQQFATSWGQVWNVRMWKEFREWYDKNLDFPHHPEVPIEIWGYPESSWAKYYQTYIVDTGKYFVYSYDSLTTNFGDAGEHFANSSLAAQSILFFGKKEYRMPEFEDGVKYDIYGEPTELGRYLGIQEDEFTCDMWGRKQEQAYRRYVLSSRKLGYKILASYGMQMKPMELNVIEKIKGNDLMLYDTSVPESGVRENRGMERIHLLEYGYGVLDGRDLLKWSIQRMKQKFWRKK